MLKALRDLLGARHCEFIKLNYDLSEQCHSLHEFIKGMNYLQINMFCSAALRVPFTPKLNFYLLIYSLPKILHQYNN